MGTVVESDIEFNYAHDGQLIFQNASNSNFGNTDPINNPNLYNLTGSFPELNPGEHIDFYINYLTPINIPFDTEVLFKDTVAYVSPISNWQNDYSPWNNVINFKTEVRGPYDPNHRGLSRTMAIESHDHNNIIVYPRGEGEEGFIAITDSILTFTINFENVRDYYAEKVLIIDSLDSNLNWNTITLISASHDFVVRLSKTGVLSFELNNIAVLAPGSKIENTAYIYFDYHEHIITNKTLNTIEIPTYTSEKITESKFSIYPNPSNNSFSVSGESIKEVCLINNMGQILLRTSKSNDIYIGNLPSGIYFVKLYTEKDFVVKKLIKN